MNAKELTEKQFQAALDKRGWKETGFLGYVRLGKSIQVSRLNGGKRLRDQLAYLLKTAKRLASQGEDIFP